jgi:hypothetical protein
MKDALVTIGATDYQMEVAAAAITPANTSVIWKGLAPAARYGAVGTEWTVELTVGQDYDLAESLSRYLLENAGTTVPVVIAPRASGQGYSVNATLAPATIGGTVETFAEGTVSLPCDPPVAVAVIP